MGIKLAARRNICSALRGLPEDDTIYVAYYVSSFGVDGSVLAALSRFYENLPDNFRDGEKGEEMQNYIEMLEEAYNSLDDGNSVIEQI